MSLTFSGATHKVNVGSGPTIDNLTVGTQLAWVNVSALTGDSRIMHKSVGGNFRIFDFINSTSELNVSHDRATVDLRITAPLANFPAYALNKWIFVASSWDASLTNGDQKLYLGDLTSLAVEPSSYSNQLVGSGANPDDSASDLIIGNKSNDNAPINGSMGPCAIFNRQLSLGEIHLWQDVARMMMGCAGLWYLGDNGTGTQPDYSGNGNHGTVTGATQSNNPPRRRNWNRQTLRALYSTTVHTQSLSGSIAPAGALVKKPKKIMSSSVTPTGALTKNVKKVFAGSVTPAGSLVKVTKKIFSGSITPVGTLTKISKKLLSGSITMTGSLVKLTKKVLNGSITPTGTLTPLRRFIKTLSGSITPTGTLSTLIIPPIVGAINFIKQFWIRRRYH